MVIPTYNEALNIEWIVGRLRAAQPGVDVMIVDDNSPDGTGDLADKPVLDDAQVSVLHRTAKDGIGAAYLHGFRVTPDRKSVVEGKSVSVRVDLGGSRIIQKKKIKHKQHR